MKTQFDEILTMYTLQAKYSGPGCSVDQAISWANSGNIFTTDDQGNRIPLSAEEALSLKNVCAKVPSWISDEIDRLADRLDMSKRQFIELALFEACQRAKVIMDDLDIDAFYRESV